MAEEITSISSDLKEQIKKLKTEKAILEENSNHLNTHKNGHNRDVKKLTWWISQAVSIIGLIYLIISIFIPTKIKINKVENSHILLFAVLLIFNSGLIEKLEDFSIDGTKLQAKFQKIEAKQEQQKTSLTSFNKSKLIFKENNLKYYQFSKKKLEKYRKGRNLP